MSQSEKIKVGLFARVSSEKQDFERQILELTNYCKNKGYCISKTIANNISGTKTRNDRPDIQELLNSAKKREFQKVIVSEVSRLGRSAKDIKATLDSLHQLKIPVIFHGLGSLSSLNDNGEESFVTNVILSIYSELAQEERRILIERTKSGLRNAVSKGKKLGRPSNKESYADFIARYPKVIKDLKEKKLTITNMMKIHDLSKNTILKIKRAIVNL